MFINDFSDSVANGSRVCNLDEMGTLTVQKRVIPEKGVQQVSQYTSGERGTLVTTCHHSALSATGNTLPPGMVFTRKYLKALMVNGTCCVLASPSRWLCHTHSR